jgi:GT2 family glycosyltransferase
VAVEAISGAFMLVRREAIARVGLLDEGYFLHCEDLDWCLRFRQAGYKILFVSDVKATHDKGLCSRDRPFRVQFHLHRGMVRYLWKHFRRAYPLPFTGLAVLGVWLRFGAVALPRVTWVRASAFVDALFSNRRSPSRAPAASEDVGARGA